MKFGATFDIPSAYPPLDLHVVAYMSILSSCRSARLFSGPRASVQKGDEHGPKLGASRESGASEKKMSKRH